MISDADMLDDATKLFRAGKGSQVAKRQNVLVRKGGDETIWRKVGEQLIPKDIDQNQACLEIPIEDYEETIIKGVHLGASLAQHHRQVADREAMKFRLAHPFCPQMPMLDVLKVGSVIDDISHRQPIAEAG